MKKLIITDSRHFGEENIHDVNLWKKIPYGLYEVSRTIPGNTERFLASWGIDINYPNNGPILFIMPFPVESIEKEESQIIEKEPMQLVQFDGNTITGDVLLKAIAIAQNPELAKDLL